MRTKVTILFDSDEIDAITKIQDIMCKYVEKAEQLDQRHTDMFDHASKIVHEIELFCTDYEVIDPDAFL